MFEYLQEVQVKTVGITAEFGGALGGVISAVTKSGGNRFTGEGHYYYLGSGLSGSPVPRLVISPIDDRTVFTVEEPKQPNHHNEIGGSFGGPIVRDKLFFFGSISPRFASTTKRISVRQRHRSRRNQARPDENERLRQSQLRQPAGERLLRHAADADHVGGARCRPTTASRSKYLSSSKAANNVNLERGYETDQTELHRQRRHPRERRRPSCACRPGISTTTTRTPAFR